MKTRPGLLLLGALPLMAGCAAFNDTVVVDIGDQAALLTLPPGGGEQRQRLRGQGFECDFEAHSQRSELFGRERRISGHIRCEPLQAAPAPSE